MDLERIKQNFRLRSGRSKKSTRKPKQQTATTTESNPNPVPSESSTTAHPNGQVVCPSSTSKADPIDQTPPNLPKEKELKSPGLVQRSDSGTGRSPTKGDERPYFFHTADDYKLDDVAERNEAKVDTDQVAAEKAEDFSHRKATPQDTTNTVTEPKLQNDDHSSDAEDFDLRPPAPRTKPPSMESMAEHLFSAGHLDALIHHPASLVTFTAFLQKYRPQDYPLLLRYLETSKAIKAIEYANAVAESVPALPHAKDDNETRVSSTAASFDPSFQQSCSSAFDTLVNTSLPLYVTFSLIRTISECLIDEVTGRGSALVQDMVGGLSEVFCLTDPNQEDNPIIYASEEFYRLTGYGRDDVIGYNCRFLQGPKTNRSSPQRLRESLDRGEEIYETLLNYRRDGRPFINVLMIAPLHDDKGNVKYHLGAQIDVSRLVERGRVLEAFQRYLIKREAKKNRESADIAKRGGEKNAKKKLALEKLRELSELFDLEESAVVQSHSRSASLDRKEEERSIGNGPARLRLDDSDASDDEQEGESTADQRDWKLGQIGPLGLSGKLPGIYEKYMLIRPAPSLRVIFVSPKLRKFDGVMQSPFLSHVAAPSNTLQGLVESFESGIPVSAKINFMSGRTERRHGTTIAPNQRHEDGKFGRACWVSATPLLGGDDKIGVWMIVFIEKAQTRTHRTQKKTFSNVSQSVESAKQPEPRQRTGHLTEHRTPGPPGTNQVDEQGGRSYELPIKPKRLDALPATVHPSNNQNSTRVYIYEAATPVEEYYSPTNDDGVSVSPVRPAPRADMPPQTPEYEKSDSDSDGQDFVQPAPNSSYTAPSKRIVIDPDSDHEVVTASGTSRRTRLDLTQEADSDNEFVDPNHIPPSVPSDQELSPSDGEKESKPLTPARSQSREREHNFGVNSVETVRQHENPPSPPSEARSTARSSRPSSRPSQTEAGNDETRAARAGGALPAGPAYMDYWRHPGSNRKTSGDITRGRRLTRDIGGPDPWNEADCAQSPYSVD